MSRPSDVGIVGLEMYVPKSYVDQSDLEMFDGAPDGKYTIGLGQLRMAFCGDLEDIVSICMTAVKNLMERYDISPSQVGRLEVGTETLVDKSKSTKTSLMELFPDGDVEGIDTTNACYGGTNALFSAVDWIESSAWDGRYAIVVCGDIAVYEKGPARPTGGCGVFAILLGPNAPLVFAPGVRSVHMENAYDFYKPVMSSEYPVVDGKLSMITYLRALDRCYSRIQKSWKCRFSNEAPLTVENLDYLGFHTPFGGLVKKAFSRLVFDDLLTLHKNGDEIPNHLAAASPWFEDHNLEDESEWIKSRECVSGMAKLLKSDFLKKVDVGMTVSKNVGNTYTGALYGVIMSLVSSGMKKGDRALCFSYGSGFASAMFVLEVKGNLSQFPNVESILADREKSTPESFTDAMARREKMPENKYVPFDSVDSLRSGTFYLEKIDELYRRTYARKE